VSEGHGRIIAIEKADHPAGPNEARGFVHDRERIVDMA